ncbi:MAG: hypothetical protein WD733_25585 [Bryobacterales bacterium]
MSESTKILKADFDAALRKLLQADAAPLETIKKRPKKARPKAQDRKVRKPKAEPDQS